MLANILFLSLIVALFAVRMGATVLAQRERDPVLRNLFHKSLGAH
jgi:hypothetical protein